jgi:carboxylesterase type B
LDQGEDCLHLNIWTPMNATYHSNLTVMIWVHGGGYVFPPNNSHD